MTPRWAPKWSQNYIKMTPKMTPKWPGNDPMIEGRGAKSARGVAQNRPLGTSRPINRIWRIRCHFCRLGPFLIRAGAQDDVSSQVNFHKLWYMFAIWSKIPTMGLRIVENLRGLCGNILGYAEALNSILIKIQKMSNCTNIPLCPLFPPCLEPLLGSFRCMHSALNSQSFGIRCSNHRFIYILSAVVVSCNAWQPMLSIQRYWGCKGYFLLAF